MTLHAKMTMPDSQRYPLKLCLIKYQLEINVFFVVENLWFSMGFSTKITCRKTGSAEIIRLKHLNLEKKYSIFHIIDQITWFQRYSCELVIPSLKGHLKCLRQPRFHYEEEDFNFHCMQKLLAFPSNFFRALKSKKWYFHYFNSKLESNSRLHSRVYWD